MKYVLALALALALALILCSRIANAQSQSECITVTHPAPAGDVVDFAQLMPMDVTLRFDYHKAPSWYGDVVFSDKIVCLKFSPAGDNWDVFSFDNDFVYGFATGTPRDYTTYPSTTSSPWAPRYAQLGSPGTRIVSRCNSWPRVIECERQPTGPLSMILISEIWGPFSHDFSSGLGGIGHQENVIALRYYWDCKSDDAVSCGHLEETWYVSPYGGVRWAHSVNVNHDGNFAVVQVETFDTIAAGGPTGLVMWCVAPPICRPVVSGPPQRPSRPARWDR